jgi:hypothetical protein
MLFAIAVPNLPTKDHPVDRAMASRHGSVRRASVLSQVCPESRFYSPPFRKSNFSRSSSL